VPDISIPLQNILTDLDNPVDLTTLSIDEAIIYIKELYSFASSALDVSIAGDIVTISIPEEQNYRTSEALQTYKRAVRAAERGRYRPAIRMFRDVLQVLPAHAEARRNLAMAYMEVDDSKTAKRYLAEVLRLKPDDAWAFLILGNLYVQFENDLESAGRLYQRAYELNPDDAYLLNSYGAFKAKRGDSDEARTLFRKAVEAAPDYPNPRYGLALSYAQEGQLNSALNALEDLFAMPQSQDARTEPVYEQARALYLDVNRRTAQENDALITGRLEEAIEDHTAETGYPVDLERDDSLSVAATTKLAWVYGQSRHIIRYKATAPAILPHLIAHEFEHIRLAHEARQAGRSKLFTSTARLEEYALGGSNGNRRKLQRRGFSDQMAADFMNRVTRGLANQLFNIPLDMIIEQRLYDQYDFLRPSQVVSLHATQLENLQALTDRTLRDIVPPFIYQSNIAMNCAYALFTDLLLQGATACATPYRKSRQFSTGRKLFQAWRKSMRQFQPGDEYDLVDQFARILKLEEWYEWQPDSRAAESNLSTDVSALPGTDGPTNLELLEQKEPATVVYLIGALKRFEDMDNEKVLQVASEAAMLGRYGLDYASPEPKYTLHSLPDEQFSGLQLMCLMYVGFKRVDPSLDTGLPFADAYSTALDMHQSNA
jgi:Tfp pilus assembly protein PilF